jgi:hypothetical protein
MANLVLITQNLIKVSSTCAANSKSIPIPASSGSHVQRTKKLICAAFGHFGAKLRGHLN